MDKKLTLSLDESTIEAAKLYAKSNKISLSKLIESYLNSLSSKTKPSEITPLVESLSGVISIDDNFDEKEEYSRFLIEKYK
jgi:hypothetical protein